MCASLAALMRNCCELSEHVNHVAWGKQATYISWREPFRWQKSTLCSLTIKTWNSQIAVCWFMLSPDILPGCHRDARFEPFKGQAPAAPAPSNKYALLCALQCPWDRFFTFQFSISNLLQCILLLHGFLLMVVHRSPFSKVHWLAHWLITKWWV